MIWGTHMKTTVEVTDPLLAAARKLARRERTTLRALIEEGLRQVLSARARRPAPFVLRPVTFKGRGLTAEAAARGAQGVLEMAYEGRGT
jgi:succinylarginine dihydrolase